MVDIKKRIVQQKIREFEIKKFLENELKRAEVGNIEINKTPLGIKLTVYVKKPRLILSRRGELKRLAEILKEKYNLDNPFIEIKEEENPDLNPKIIAREIAVLLERGFNFRRVAYMMLNRIIQAGALGAEIELSGKLVSERAKSFKFTWGYLKKCGDPAYKYVRVAYDTALTKPGVIGIIVKILPPVDLPDKPKIIDKEIKVEEKEVDEGGNTKKE